MEGVLVEVFLLKGISRMNNCVAVYDVIEVGRDGLMLVVYDHKKESTVYVHEGYEKDGEENSLRADVNELRRLTDCVKEVPQWELNTASKWTIDKVKAFLSSGEGRVVADENDVYFERMRGVAKRVFIR